MTTHWTTFISALVLRNNAIFMQTRFESIPYRCGGVLSAKQYQATASININH